MSTENDVPLGEGARRYYEEQFGERIRKVSKGGNRPRSGGSGGNWGKSGCGTVFLIFIALRIVGTLFRSSPSTTTYHSTPLPPPIQFQQPMQVNELAPEQLNAIIGGNEERADLLGNDDVPLLQGLCYRIYQESLRPEPTLGGHLLKSLEPGLREWLIEVARGKELDPLEQRLFITSLNLVLTQDNMWEGKALLDVPAIQELIRTHKIPQPPLRSLTERRRVLELCYPRQIIPLEERDHLNAQLRAKWKRIAKADLEAARKEYEPAKR